MSYTSTIDKYFQELSDVLEAQGKQNYLKEQAILCQRISKYENELGKSFAEFSTIEVLEAITGDNPSTKTIGKYKDMAKQYVNWLYKNKLISYEDYATHIVFDNRNVSLFVKESPTLRKKIEQKYFYSAEEFIEVISKVYDADHHRGDITRFASEIATLYLLWQGFELADIVEIKKTDIDIETHTIKNVYIYNETMWNFLLDYNSTEIYRAYKGKKGFYYERYLVGDTFIKGKLTEPTLKTLQTLVDEAKRRSKLAAECNYILSDANFSSLKIRTSGIFERMWMWEEETKTVIDNKNINTVIKTLDNKKHDRTTNYYLVNDYTIWKEIKKAR